MKSFSRAFRNQLYPTLLSGHSWFYPVLSTTLLPGRIYLVWQVSQKSLSTSVWYYPIVAGFYAWYRNMNLFPFCDNHIKATLRTDLPWADWRCPGTLAFSIKGVLTLFSAYYYQDLHISEVHRSSPTCFAPRRSKTYRIIPNGMPMGIGSQF